MLLNRINSSLLLTGLSFYHISSANAFGWHHGLGFGFHQYSSQAEISFEDTNGQQNSQIDTEFSSESSSQQLDSLFSAEGYSTNHKWLIEYSISQYSLEDERSNELSYRLTGFNANLFVGHNIFEVNNNIRLYALLGAQYQKQNFRPVINGMSGQKISTSEFSPMAGLQLDIPFTKYWVMHLKGNAGINSDNHSASLGINFRASRHWTLLAEYQTRQLEFIKASPTQANYYHFDGDLDRFSIKAVLIW
ncbi:hypothetical protein N7931_18400 [Catenovulum sp. 2E275]|uniref:hypothetical protein n=1 Tax=Catenovulum sp. 2E275 TaxID=2980497 RepID=UPI0021D30681|nr:hypothetical protein [Catenovulum sp. 2E275]MCU4677593.1 hypothetical protein [Catenovulum sp. 2E275]